MLNTVFIRPFIEDFFNLIQIIIQFKHLILEYSPHNPNSGEAGLPGR